MVKMTIHNASDYGFSIEGQTGGGDNARENTQITSTWVGREYGWDFLSDVNYDLLQQNLDCMWNVMGDPERFPNADCEALDLRINEIEAFLSQHPRWDLDY